MTRSIKFWNLEPGKEYFVQRNDELFKHKLVFNSLYGQVIFMILDHLNLYGLFIEDSSILNLIEMIHFMMLKKLERKHKKRDNKWSAEL